MIDVEESDSVVAAREREKRRFEEMERERLEDMTDAASASTQLMEAKWGDLIGGIDDPLVADDDVVRFIGKGGEMIHGHWNTLKCGCEAYVLAWQTSGESTARDWTKWEPAPSPFATCCGETMMFVDSYDLPDGSSRIAQALVRRHSVGCELYKLCPIHIY